MKILPINGKENHHRKRRCMPVDPNLLAAVTTAEAALVQSVSAEAVTAGTIVSDQTNVTNATLGVTNAQAALDASNKQLADDTTLDVAAKADVKAKAQTLDSAL